MASESEGPPTLESVRASRRWPKDSRVPFAKPSLVQTLEVRATFIAIRLVHRGAGASFSKIDDRLLKCLPLTLVISKGEGGSQRKLDSLKTVLNFAAVLSPNGVRASSFDGVDGDVIWWEVGVVTGSSASQLDNDVFWDPLEHNGAWPRVCVVDGRRIPRAPFAKPSLVQTLEVRATFIAIRLDIMTLSCWPGRWLRINSSFLAQFSGMISILFKRYLTARNCVIPTRGYLPVLDKGDSGSAGSLS